MNPQPNPQKNETHEARTKENETHRCGVADVLLNSTIGEREQRDERENVVEE